jgi:hypothetical protein
LIPVLYVFYSSSGFGKRTTDTPLDTPPVKPARIMEFLPVYSAYKRTGNMTQNIKTILFIM